MESKCVPVSKAIDIEGVAVITGGGSGFGRSVAECLVAAGMIVAVLDVSKKELDQVRQDLGEAVLPVHCDVTRFDECAAAAATVRDAYPTRNISFLFNNAGILGAGNLGQIISGPPAETSWAPIFAVNVFGAANILKAFIPGIIQAGPLASGKASLVVTTSSVVGLLNHNPGPYSLSKHACTALCEQLVIELDTMPAASHISAHSLHPTIAATNFLAGRDASGNKSFGDGRRKAAAKSGMESTEFIVDGLFRGLEDGRRYIIVDGTTDIPSVDQMAHRFVDQVSSGKPRTPKQLGAVLRLMDDGSFKKRLAELGIDQSKL